MKVYGIDYRTVTRLSGSRASHGHYTHEIVHATPPGDEPRTLCGVEYRLGVRRGVEWMRHWADKIPTCNRCRARLGLPAVRRAANGDVIGSEV